LQEKQDEWKNIPLNIGVIGNSGVGKSSFINTIRGLEGDDPGAADVGVNETTMEPTPYEHPNNPKLKFWDLPGIGTLNFPQNSYLNKIGFEQFDFFIVLSANRFTENDKWLADAINQCGKKLCFARSKIGSDIDNDKKAHPKKHNPQVVIDSIRQNISNNLKQLRIQARWFIIDSYERERTDLDFNKLEKYLIEDFPEIKREALILSLNVFSATVIYKKVEILQQRIWEAAALSAAGAVIPVPGLSIAIDCGILLKEIVYYYKQMGLDMETVRKTCRMYSVDENRVMAIIQEALPQYGILWGGKITHITLEATLEVVKQLIPPIMITERAAAEEVARCIPMIGWIVAAPISFYTTYTVLNNILRNFENVALNVVNMYIEETI